VIKEIVSIIEEEVISIYWKEQSSLNEVNSNIGLDCTLINKMLGIMRLKTFSLMSSIVEKQIIYTPFLNQLYEYLELNYSSITEDKYLLMEMARAD